MTARFITVEGIDGAGKSSHLGAVAEQLRAAGREVVLTREPGGSPLAEALRALFLSEPMDALTEALLMFAARRDHVVTVIAPALARGATVLCDRFSDATFAYQGGGRGFDAGVLRQLETWVQQPDGGAGPITPDLTLWFDVAPEVAAQRRAAARGADRLEAEDAAFFARVRAAYVARAAAAPERIVRIDASAALAEVAARVRATIAGRALA